MPIAETPGIYRAPLIYPGEIPGLPPLPRSRAEWPDFYQRVLEHRVQTAYRCAVSEEARAREVAKVERDGRYWLATYGAIYEARPDLYGDETPSAIIPWVPYPFQLFVWDWLEERYRSRGAMGDTLLPKSRDMGLSNLAGAFALHKWGTTKPFQGRLLSYKEDLVDNAADPDSIMWKIDTLLRAQPRWLVHAWSPSFDWKSHRRDLALVNPDNQNLISGDSTGSRAGTGRRASLYILDEFGKMRDGGRIWTETRAATPHRFALGTVHTQFGMHMHNLHFGRDGYTQPPVLEIPSDSHPLHDEAWHREERKRDTKEGFAREVEMNYFAGEGNWVYPMTHRVELVEAPLEPYAGPLFVSIDDGLASDFAAHWIQYHLPTGRHRVVRSYHKSGEPTHFHGTILTGLPNGQFRYTEEDLDLMRWVRSLPGATYVGDTHGYNDEQTTGQAPYDILLRDFNISVIVDFEKRTLKDRRTYTEAILPMTDFNQHPSVDYTLWCFKRHRYPTLKDGHERTTLLREPVRDETTHPVTAFEFYATLWPQLTALARGQQVVYEGPQNLG